MIETTRAHCLICGYEVDLPADLLGGMSRASALIADAVRAAGASESGVWSAAEIAAHLADVELGLGWRIRRTLAETEPELEPFDQERWASALRYSERDAETSLAAYAAQRAANVELLSHLSDGEWERRFRHREFGVQPLRVLVRHIADHDLEHLLQIEAGA
jgi:hypothetical protein